MGRYHCNSSLEKQLYFIKQPMIVIAQQQMALLNLSFQPPFKTGDHGLLGKIAQLALWAPCAED